MDKPSLEESLRALSARRRSDEPHPDPDELVAYQAGGMAVEEADRIQEHLTQCRDCARLLLDLADFEQLALPPEELGPVDARAEASWQRLRNRLREEEEPTAEPYVLQRRRRLMAPTWRRPALPWALAAGLALCVVGLGMRTGILEQRLADLSRPRVPSTILLESEDDGSRGGGDETLLRAGEPVRYELLLAGGSKSPAYSLYSIRMVAVSGHADPVPVGRQPADQGFLHVYLASAPAAGAYVFEVSGIEGGREVPVGRYPFEILPPR